ncbi:PH domain-containing protein [Nonomuraea sp. NPDC000554]|uniref:PH domain-containing protein n=1 Tax=Nonomuraea sp. NPDC000554 TaxID=3154259 RepID=UPI00331B875B
MTSTDSVASVAEEPGWRRLSPLMLAVHPVQEVVRLLPVLVGVLFIGRNDNGPLWSLIGLGVAVGLGLVRWLTTTYRVTPDQVLVRRGLLRRQVLTVPRDRVRTVDLTSHILQRVLGLSRVVIGTGRSDRGDQGVTLDALSTAEASRLREELLHRGRPSTVSSVDTGSVLEGGPETGGPGGGAPIAGVAEAGGAAGGVSAPGVPASGLPAPGGPRSAVPGRGLSAAGVREAERLDDDEVEVAALDPAWIRFGPFTLAGLATIGVLAGAMGQVFNETRLNPRDIGALRAVYDQLNAVAVPLAVLEVTIGAVALVALLSTIGYVLAFWNFRLTRHREGTLHVTRGLLTTRSTTIEHRRVAGVEISEPLLLRLVRGARLIAIATGLRVGRGAERGGSLLLPPSPVAEVQRVAGEVYGEPSVVTCALKPHGPAARRRRYTRALAAAALVTAAFLLLWRLAGWPAWTWQAALALFPIGLLLAADRYRSLGHNLLGGNLVVRQGSLVRRRHVLSTDGVIGLIVHESFFQRRAGVATLTATTAAGKQHYEAVDIEAGEAASLADATLPGLLTPFLERRPPA